MILKKRNVKNIYIEEVYCEKCGAPMVHTGVVLTTYPAQYPFKCSNEECEETHVFQEDELPGRLKYEFEDIVEDLPVEEPVSEEDNIIEDEVVTDNV